MTETEQHQHQQRLIDIEEQRAREEISVPVPPATQLPDAPEALEAPTDHPFKLLSHLLSPLTPAERRHFLELYNQAYLECVFEALPLAETFTLEFVRPNRATAMSTQHDQVIIPGENFGAWLPHAILRCKLLAGTLTIADVQCQPRLLAELAKKRREGLTRTDGRDARMPRRVRRRAQKFPGADE